MHTLSGKNFRCFVVSYLLPCLVLCFAHSHPQAADCPRHYQTLITITETNDTNGTNYTNDIHDANGANGNNDANDTNDVNYSSHDTSRHS